LFKNRALFTYEYFSWSGREVLRRGFQSELEVLTSLNLFSIKVPATQLLITSLKSTAKHDVVTDTPNVEEYLEESISDITDWVFRVCWIFQETGFGANNAAVALTKESTDTIQGLAYGNGSTNAAR